MDSGWGLSLSPQLPSHKAKGLKICVTFPGTQQPGEVWNASTRPGLTLSLPDWKTKTLDVLVSIVSTCILHDNIAGGILMFCNLWTLERCVCVTEQCQNPPLPEQAVNAKPSPSSHTIFDCQFRMCFEPVKCTVVYFKDGLCQLCLLIFVLFLCFFLLLCSYAALHPLNGFESKSQKYIILDTGTVQHPARVWPFHFHLFPCSYLPSWQSVPSLPTLFQD